MQPQNFSIPAGNDQLVTFTADSTISGFQSAIIYWRAYTQQYGVPIAGVAAVIEKSNVSPLGVTVLESPPSFTVDLIASDTVGLLRNYYHEATVVDVGGNTVTVAFGTMTVTETENR